MPRNGKHCQDLDLGSSAGEGEKWSADSSAGTNWTLNAKLWEFAEDK
jgi:hypothetical protein